MIHLQLEGMIGNNLFQYALARLLAEETGYALEINHSPYASFKNTPQLMELMGQFADAPLSLPGKRFDEPEDRSAWMEEGGFDGYRIDWQTLKNPLPERKICLKGYFERYEYYRPYKERIRGWFSVPPLTLGHDIGDEDVVLHLRRGDFVVFGRAISLSYYVELLEQLSYRRLYICGYGLDAEVKNTFAPFDPVYVTDTPANDFRFMMSFRRMIQSQSTFSWWAGFLSEADELYAPLTIPDSTDFERNFPHIDLVVDDEERYRFIRDVPQLERELNLWDVLSSWQHLSRRGFVLGVAEQSKRAVLNGFRRIFTR